MLPNSDKIRDGCSPDGKLFAAVGIYGALKGKGAVIVWHTDTFDTPKELKNEGHHSNSHAPMSGCPASVNQNRSLIGSSHQGARPWRLVCSTTTSFGILATKS